MPTYFNAVEKKNKTPTANFTNYKSRCVTLSLDVSYYVTYKCISFPITLLSGCTLLSTLINIEGGNLEQVVVKWPKACWVDIIDRLVLPWGIRTSKVATTSSRVLLTSGLQNCVRNLRAVVAWRRLLKGTRPCCRFSSSDRWKTKTFDFLGQAVRNVEAQSTHHPRILHILKEF